ncbi:MAG: arginase [Bacteroidetes bacterium]|nr:arginase [Bacteroidota bacterium]
MSFDFNSYFSPVDVAWLDDKYFAPHSNYLASVLDIHRTDFPVLEGKTLAILGVPDSPHFPQTGIHSAPDALRRCLYRLFRTSGDLQAVDLGNLFPGNTPEDTYAALADVCQELQSMSITPVVLGGSRDLLFGQYRAFEKNIHPIELLGIDARFHLGEAPPDEDYTLDPRDVLMRIVTHKPSHLFNYTNLGYQTYLNNPDEVLMIGRLLFDAMRLGDLRAAPEEAEPAIRIADLMYVDASCLRLSDMPGQPDSTPSGLFSHELCQLTRYAGLNEKLKSIGFYSYDPARDKQLLGAETLAQAIWYFLEGHAHRSFDVPRKNQMHHIRYVTTLDSGNHTIVFYKSRKTGRWWMEIASPAQPGSNKERGMLIPCSYADYKTASRGEMPDRWWRYHQKHGKVD